MSAIEKLLTDNIDIWTAADAPKKSGRGRASNGAGSVYGIKKLRELILELAVRGKLVPQDPNDEPASELLKRIQAEKAKLVAAGKIKKSKPLPPITDEEKPFELPRGWAYSALGDVVEIVRGITFPANEKSKFPEKGRIACLRTTNVQDRIEWDDLLYIREQFVSRKDQILAPRDIVISMANSRELVGKVALVDKEIHQKTSFGGFLAVLRPFLIEPRFLMSLLRTPDTREKLIDSASQTTNIANISLAKLNPLCFAIPPLVEQHRIVTKIDELMALCDELESQHINSTEAHEKLVKHLLGTLTQSQNAEDFNENWQRISAHFDTLFTTEASIDSLKQTLLQLAVMGKLVPQDPNDEPASELLKRIKAEKAKLVAEGKIKKEKPFPPITDEEKPFELPRGWEWVRLGVSLLKITDGTHHSPENTLKGIYKYITAKNIKPWGIDLSEITHVSKEVHEEIYSRCDPVFGDILYIKDGATTGIATINKLNEQFSMLSSVALLKPSIGVDNQFLLKTLISPLFYSAMRLEMSGVAITRVTLAKLGNAIIPLPPIIEQHRIIIKVDELTKLCDQLKSRMINGNLLQQKLVDVIIGEVFRN
jgi:type I restriction enzyme S subunit